MSLGIFNRLFNLLERPCQDLDLEMAARAAGEGIGGATYQLHVKALGDLARVKEQQESAQQRATLYGQLATHFLLSISISGSEQSPLVRQIEQEASAAKREAEELVNGIAIVFWIPPSFHVSSRLLR